MRWLCELRQRRLLRPTYGPMDFIVVGHRPFRPPGRRCDPPRHPGLRRRAGRVSTGDGDARPRQRPSVAGHRPRSLWRCSRPRGRPGGNGTCDRSWKTCGGRFVASGVCAQANNQWEPIQAPAWYLLQKISAEDWIRGTVRLGDRDYLGIRVRSRWGISLGRAALAFGPINHVCALLKSRNRRAVARSISRSGTSLRCRCCRTSSMATCAPGLAGMAKALAELSTIVSLAGHLGHGRPELTKWPTTMRARQAADGCATSWAWGSRTHLARLRRASMRTDWRSRIAPGRSPDPPPRHWPRPLHPKRNRQQRIRLNAGGDIAALTSRLPGS